MPIKLDPVLIKRGALEWSESKRMAEAVGYLHLADDMEVYLHTAVGLPFLTHCADMGSDQRIIEEINKTRRYARQLLASLEYREPVAYRGGYNE
jgi:hypothetical protein